MDKSTEVRPRRVLRRGIACGPRVPNDPAGSVLEELYRAFFLRLVRRATWRYGLSKEDAREVVHDAFVLAMVKLDIEGNPSSWLYSVVDRLSANWKRKEERHERLLALWSAPAGPPEEAPFDEEGA